MSVEQALQSAIVRTDLFLCSPWPWAACAVILVGVLIVHAHRGDGT